MPVEIIIMLVFGTTAIMAKLSDMLAKESEMKFKCKCGVWNHRHYGEIIRYVSKRVEMKFKCKWFIQYYSEPENYFKCYIFHPGCTKEFKYNRETQKIDFVYCPHCGKEIKFTDIED